MTDAKLAYLTELRILLGQQNVMSQRIEELRELLREVFGVDLSREGLK